MACPSGVLSRDAAIQAIEPARPWERFEIQEPEVVGLGDDRGVVVDRVLARRPGDKPYAGVVRSTFVRDHGGWKLAFHQQSPSP